MRIIEDNDAKKMARDPRMINKIESVLLNAKVYEALHPLICVVNQQRKYQKDTFVIILANALEFDVKNLFLEQKRFSDILVEIDENRACYALVCLDTKVEGGFHFAQRLLRHMKTGFAKDIYMAVVDVRGGNHSADDILFTLMDIHSKAMLMGRQGEAVLHSMM